MDSINIINALLYVPIPVLACMTLLRIHRAPGRYSTVLALHALCGLVVATIFVYLQVLWIIGEHDNDLPPFEAIGWAVHDFTSAVFYLSSSAGAYLLARGCDAAP